MKLFDAEMLAIHLMRDHGLSSWKLRFSNAKSYIGLCRRFEQAIYLSAPYIEVLAEDEVRDTILHEIAHALEHVRYRTCGHGLRWRAICVEIGATPKACAKVSAHPKAKYTAICADCGYSWGQHRKSWHWIIQPDGSVSVRSPQHHRKCRGKQSNGRIDWYVTESMRHREAAQKPEVSDDETKSE